MDMFLITAVAFFMVNAFVFVSFLRKIDLNGAQVKELERAQAADAYARTAAKARKARALASAVQVAQ
ncbi:hypothetical protein [Rheinheimera sp.]|uniref:hypothetical protein n=1 Tax=Rheinheimera sp. TaxID=1869214 RepID=UPI00307E837D